jgi:hypothetical protein
VHIYLRLDESLRATRRWSEDTDRIVIEANKRTVGSEPSATWIKRVLEALCQSVRPAIATASTLGERVSASKRYGDRSHTLEWLTYFGASATRRLELDSLLSAPAEAVMELGNGVLLVVDRDPGPGRTVRYWGNVEAIQGHLRAELVADILRNRRRSDQPPIGPQERPQEREGPRRLLRGLKRHVTSTKAFADTRFAGMGFTRAGGVAAGYRFERCTFDNVRLGSDRPSKPVVVRDSSLLHAKAWAAFLGWVIVEDCLVDGFEGDAIWPVDSLLLRHVTLKGAIGAVDIRDPRQLHPDDSRRRDAHRDFYSTVDWALDIRDARFRRADLSGIPGRLVRRDPATQVLVTLDRLQASRWRELDFRETAWDIGFQEMEEAALEAVTFVAEPRGKRFEAHLRVIDDLRRFGIAEPD